MKQPSRKVLENLKREAKDNSKWEEVEGFNASRPTSIRLAPELIERLEKIAELRGERSYQTLLKKWVSERVNYEMELVKLARKKKAG